MGGWQTVRLANPIFSTVSNSSSNGGDASRVGVFFSNLIKCRQTYRNNVL